MTEDADEPEIELSGEKEGAPLDVTRVPLILSLSQVKTSQVSSGDILQPLLLSCQCCLAVACSCYLAPDAESSQTEE